jgi:hypothetical protein
VLIQVKNSIEELMDDIIEPNSTFDFTRLTLAQPTGIQGGAYFTKLLHNAKPLYIQTPKSLTKQGFVKNGKKIYCDLMFDNNDEQFITWIENLETKCHNLIFDKSDAWFQNSLDLNDIETAFNSVLKSYKSGKKYLVRTNVKVNSLSGTPIIKIYNENEIPLTLEDVNHETNIISILEIQGIKFTSRNFQIEIELKQTMVLNTDKIFENCLIKKKSTAVNLDETTKSSQKNSDDELIQVIQPTNIIIEDLEEEKEVLNEVVEPDEVISLKIEEKNEAAAEQNDESIEEEQETKQEDKPNTESETETIKNLNQDDINNFDIVPIELSFNDESLETITLKKPNQVYYELYKEAREKAKQAKKEAVLAYLEAKNIKKTYMLEDIDSSDDSDIENLDSDFEEE